MVTIRLARGGAKARPFYHVVVSDSRMKRDGRHIERLGYFNPSAAEAEQSLRIDRARYDHWLSVGAQPSERVKKLVKSLPEAAPAESDAA
ncbi:MAG: 30S ribosomal protein S16 [Pseudomonadota bacterium]